MVNNAISLVYLSNHLSPDAISDQKLKVVYQGNDLGDDYAISFKKIVQGEELRGNVKLKDKYLWTPLKVKDGNGDETWVKILKSDLKQTFQIGDDDLLGVKDIQGLESLIGVHLNKIFDGESQVSENNGLYRSIVKFFLCHFVVYPTAKRTVQKAIENKKPEQLTDIYVKDAESLLATVTGRLQKKHESSLEFFGSEMISQIIDEALIAEANKQLKKEKQAPWDENKLLKLNELRVVEFFRKNPDEINNDEELKKIDPISIPIAKLAEIPVTEKNLAVLKTVWKKVADDLHTKGKLGVLKLTTDERENILKAHFAGLYLDAYHLMPKEVREGLRFEKAKIENITHFALQNSTLEKGALENEKKIYSEKIQPIIEEALGKYTDSPDISKLLTLYMRIGQEDLGIDTILKAINTDLKVNEKELFIDSRLRSLIFKEIEKNAILKYGLTTNQLNNLEAYKDSYNKKIDEFAEFSLNVKRADSELSVFKLLDFEKLINMNDKRKIENVLPTAFPKIEAGYETSPLMDLDRQLAVKKLQIAQERLNTLKRAPQKPLYGSQKKGYSLLDDDSSNLATHEERLKVEISNGVKYISNLEKRKQRYLDNNEVFERGNEHINKLLYNPKIKEEILKTSQDSLLKPEIQIELMELDVLLNKCKLNTIIEVSNLNQKSSAINQAESKAVLELLEKVKNDPKLIQTLKSFKGKKKDQISERILENIPSFLQGFIKKILLKDQQPVPEINKVPAGISEDTINFVLEFILRTEKMETLTKSLDKALFKADYLLKKYAEEPLSIAQDERLNLQQLGVLSSVERLSIGRHSDEHQDFTAELKKMGLLENNSLLKDFVIKAERSKEILEKINKIIKNDVNEHYQAGDLFAYNNDKKVKWQDKPPELEQKLTAFVADNLTHGGKLYREDGKIQTSHLVGNVLRDDLSLYEICISDVWELNVAPLIPENFETHFERIFGDQWKAVINTMHQNIENDLQIRSKELDKFEGLRNDESRRVLAGVANYSSLLNFLGKKDIKGHERDFEKDFNELHAEFFSENKIKEKQICSEFASKMTLVSMIELNNQLTKKLLEDQNGRYDTKQILKEMSESGSDFSLDVQEYAQGVRYKGFSELESVTSQAEAKWRELLEKRGYTPSEIELVIRIGNNEILDLPYSKKERLKAIHPGRMVSILVEKGCAVKREPLPAIQALINID